MTFQRWMQEVNEICINTYAVSIYDMPGLDFYFAFESGQSPAEFFEEMTSVVNALAEVAMS